MIEKNILNGFLDNICKILHCRSIQVSSIFVNQILKEKCILYKYFQRYF